jgi:hypothetical protein
MKTTAFAAALVLVLIPLGPQIVVALADSPPKLNVGPSCDAAAKGAVSVGRDKAACMGDEPAARELLAKNWSQYSGAHKTQCVGMTSQGSSSYVELISCLDIMRDAEGIRKADPYYGRADEKPKRAPSGQRTRRSST